MIISDFFTTGRFWDIHEQRLRLGCHDEGRTESLELRRVAFLCFFFSLFNFKEDWHKAGMQAMSFLRFFSFSFSLLKSSTPFLVFSFLVKILFRWSRSCKNTEGGGTQ